MACNAESKREKEKVTAGKKVPQKPYACYNNGQRKKKEK